METSLRNALSVCVLSLFCGEGALASTVPIISGDGTETCIQGPALNGGQACSVQQITRFNVWQSENPLGRGATWISYDNTSPPGTAIAPWKGSSSNPDGTTIIAIFEEHFYAAAGDALTINVWADDTVGIKIDDVLLVQPCFTGGDFLCPDTPIAFDTQRGGLVNHTFSSTGKHKISFETYQIGTGQLPEGNPFGLLYSGELETTFQIPEPTTLALMTLGLAGIGFSRRRYKKAA